MKKCLSFITIAIICNFSMAQLDAQIITTIAGASGTGTYTGDGGMAVAATFNHPTSVHTDGSGSVFITDAGNHCVRKINTIGVINKTAGTPGSAGFSGDGGLANLAQLNNPTDVVTDGSGYEYIVDQGNNRIRMVNAFSVISEFAGCTSCLLGDGGPATNASLSIPDGIAIDVLGNVFVADFNNGRIRKINPLGVITTIAGCPLCGYIDGVPATSSNIGNPRSIALDGVGNLYFTDGGNHKVRKVSMAGIITTVAGSGSAVLSGDDGPATAAGIDPYGICSDLAGNLFVADYSNNRVRKINLSGIITTFAGGGTSGIIDGVVATLSALGSPYGVSLNSSGYLYICEQGSGRIRLVTVPNYPPAFTGGSPQSLTVCENSWFNPIDALLSAIDSNMGQTLTWRVTSAPAHGTIAVGSALATTGGVVTPTGSFYAPTTGYVGTDAFTVQVTDGSATATTIINVTVNPLPMAAAVSGDSTVCTGAAITLTDVIAGGAWTSAFPVATVSVTGIVTGVSAGTDTIRYAVTNSCGTAIAQKVITVNTTPGVSGIIGYPVLCEGSSIALVDFTAGGVWSSSAPAVGTVGSTTGVVRGISGGTADITYAVTNVCGTTNVIQPVTVNPLPPLPAPIAGTSVLCVGSSTLFSESATGGAWTSDALTVATVGSSSGSVSAIATGTANISYTVTNTCGSVSAIFPVTVNTVPDAGVISGPDTICTGRTITLIDTVSGGTWTSGGLVAAVSGGIVSGLGAGIDTIVYSVTNSCGTARDSFLVFDKDCISAVPAISSGSNPELSVFPNPNDGTFIVKLNSGQDEQVDMIICNVMGVILTRFPATTNQPFSLQANLSPGIYFLTALIQEGRFVSKIVVR